MECAQLGASRLRNKGGTGQLLSAFIRIAGLDLWCLSPLDALEDNAQRDVYIDRKIYYAKVKSERKNRELNRKLEGTGHKQKHQQSQQEARNRVRASEFEALLCYFGTSTLLVFKRPQHKLGLKELCGYRSSVLPSLYARQL